MRRMREYSSTAINYGNGLGKAREGVLFGERVLAGAGAWRLLPSASTAEAPRLADAGRAGLRLKRWQKGGKLHERGWREKKCILTGQ